MSYIYESPDGGTTIYKRQIGSTDRLLHHIDEKKKMQDALDAEWIVWKQILIASQKNPALQQTLAQARVIYELSRVND